MKKFNFAYYFATVALAMAWSVAFAQAPQVPAEYSVKLTAPEVDIVGKALGAMPYQDVALLIQKLREQIVAQQQAKPVDEKK